MFSDEAVIKINSQNKQDIPYTQVYNKQSQLDDIIVIYNRVPKTGSTSFVGVVYDLCKKNKFHSLHINVTNNMHTLTLANQVCKFLFVVLTVDINLLNIYKMHVSLVAD